MVSPPMAFIFEWNSHGEHAVAEIDEAGAGVLLHDPVVAHRFGEDEQTRPARRVGHAQLVSSGGEGLGDDGWHVGDAGGLPLPRRPL